MAEDVKKEKETRLKFINRTHTPPKFSDALGKVFNFKNKD